jgi:hypothetical protein
MKTLAVISLALMLLLGGGGMAWAQMGSGFGPWSEMGGHGVMSLRHRLGPRGELGWHSMGFALSGLTLAKDQAAQIAQAHLRAIGNPNLKLGDLSELDTYYEAPILTSEGSFVEKLLLDKRTGWVRSVY